MASRDFTRILYNSFTPARKKDLAGGANDDNIRMDTQIHQKFSQKGSIKHMGIRDKNSSWLKPRHRIVRDIACAVLRPYCRIKYGIRPTPFAAQGDRAYLILMNHQTPFDQFFVGLSFKGAVYYLATEDIFSLGLISSILRWLVAPIPIKKQTTDIAAVRACLRVAKEGGTIAMAPEGNRTYSGKTEYINPAVASLAKKMKLPIALYRIEGGYGVQPRWSDGVRKGQMRAYVARVIEPEEYATLTNEELYELIKDGLAVNEAAPGGLYRSKRRAEYLERAIYVCPYCGLSEFESRGNVTTCKSCRRQIEYGEGKRLRGIGFDFPFEYMDAWYEYQRDYICAMDVTQNVHAPLFCDRARLSEVILYKRKRVLRRGADIRLYGDRITIDKGRGNELIFPFDDTAAVTVLGRNKLNIYHEGRVYQLKGSKHFNALKYVNIFFRYKNIRRGDLNGKFLGL